MNKLFSILMQYKAVPAAFAWYAKRTSPVMITSKMKKLVDIVTLDVPDTRLALYVSNICYLVLQTQYGPEILQLDPDNTYVPVKRDPNVAHSNQDYCMHNLIQPAGKYKMVKAFLDNDILDLVDTNSWLDCIGAACLQLLREASK